MSEPTLYEPGPNRALGTETMAYLVRKGVLVERKRCEHVGPDFPNGHIEGHWEPMASGSFGEWCPGAGIGGDYE